MSAPPSQPKFPSTPTASNGSGVPAHRPTCQAAVVIPKVERPGIFYVTLPFPPLRPRRPSCRWDTVIVCVQGITPSRAFLASSAGLTLLRASENDIGGVIVFVPLGVPFAMGPTTPVQGVQSSGDGSDKCCCCFSVSDSGVACHKGGPRLLPRSRRHRRS